MRNVIELKCQRTPSESDSRNDAIYTDACKKIKNYYVTNNIATIKLCCITHLY